jgi:hypothetical protein
MKTLVYLLCIGLCYCSPSVLAGEWNPASPIWVWYDEVWNVHDVVQYAPYPYFRPNAGGTAYPAVYCYADGAGFTWGQWGGYSGELHGRDGNNVPTDVPTWVSLTDPSAPVATASNMTLCLNPITLAFVPAYALASIVINVGTSTLATSNLVMSVSRDNGTTWSEGTVTLADSWDTSNRLVTASITLTNQPTGSNVLFKLSITNSPPLVTVKGMAAPCSPE